jgi:polyvinyl alcohol dehydrogenase (cytochrome)
MHRLRLLIALTVAAGSVWAGGVARAAGCAEGGAGGEWPSYSGDLSNSRHQASEDRISPDTAYDIELDWAFAAGSGAGALGFQSTPVMAGGCVFVASAGGVVFALNADTGELVWQSEALGGGIFAVAVSDGRVLANVSSEGGPSAAALDQTTGQKLWQTVIDTDSTAYTNSSAVSFDGMLFYGISGGEDGPGADGPHPGGFAILDATSGQILKRTYTIPPAEQELGYYGASIWGTAVIDDDKYAYVGTGQPANKAKEHELSNSLIKIDVDPSRATFGQIVDAYKGDPDSYVPGLAQQPACQQVPQDVSPGYGNCFALDVDFGASPTMFKDGRGNTLVGDLQKSGVYHAVYTDTMQEAWSTILSVPLALGNAGSSANDGKAVYVKTTPGLLYSLDPNHGRINWVMPVADAVDYQPVSVANGVVYVVSTHGLLLSFDAGSGLPVGARSLAADTHDACASPGAGVAVANNRIYTVCDVGVQGGGWVVAYGFDGDAPLGPWPLP